MQLQAELSCDPWHFSRLNQSYGAYTLHPSAHQEETILENWLTFLDDVLRFHVVLRQMIN